MRMGTGRSLATAASRASACCMLARTPSMAYRLSRPSVPSAWGSAATPAFWTRCCCLCCWAAAEPGRDGSALKASRDGRVQSMLGSRVSASCCPGATFSIAKLLRPLLMLSWLAR